MLKRLKLNNFKCHAEVDITFTEGLNGIFGGNYTGKSTLLKGILYCLGGATSAGSATLQKHGTNTNFKQELWFQAGDKEYHILRTKTKASLSRLTEHGSELVAEGTMPVNQAIEEILGMSMRRFRQLRYAEQGRTDAMLSLGIAELHNVIQEVSGSDKIEPSLAKLKEIVTFCTGKLDGVVEVDIAEMVARRDALEETLLERNASLVQDMESHNDVSADLAEASKLYQVAMAVRENCDRLMGQRSHIDGQVASLVDQRAKVLSDLEGLPVSDSRGMDALHDRVVGVMGVAKVMADLESRVFTTRQAAESAQKVLDKESSKVVTIPLFDADQHNRLASEAEDAEEAYKDLSVQTIKANKALEEGVCAECNRPYDDFDRPEAEAKALALAAALKVSEITVAALRAKLAVSSSREEAASKAQDMADRHASVIQIHSAEVARSEAVYQDLVGNLTAVKVSSGYADSTAAMDAAQTLQASLTAHQNTCNQQERLTSEASALTQKITALKAQSADITSALADEGDVTREQVALLADKTITLTEVQARLAGLIAGGKADMDNIASRIKMCADEIVRGETHNQTMAQTTARLNTAKALARFLKTNRDRYMAEVWSSFLAQASQFASACTNGNISEISRSDNGKFQFHEGEFVVDVKDASGSQSSIMGLGVQMALADAMACPLDMILCDEPTSDMDTEHSLATATMLAVNGRQVICISHRELDSTVCNNSIFL